MGQFTITNLMVGTAKGSKVSNSLRSMGTEMRPGQSSKGKNYIKTVSLINTPSTLNHIRSRLTCFGMDTEGALQQMVHSFTDVHIEPGVTILQHDLFLKVLALFGSAL